MDSNNITRYTNGLEPDLPLLAVDLGYSARSKSCGVAWAGGAATSKVCARVPTAVGPH